MIVYRRFDCVNSNALILSVFFLCFFGIVMCGDSTVQLKLENFVSFLHLPTLELKNTAVSVMMISANLTAPSAKETTN